MVASETYEKKEWLYACAMKAILCVIAKVPN